MTNEYRTKLIDLRSDSITKSTHTAYDPAQLALTFEKWRRRSTSGGVKGTSVRGFYDYAATAIPSVGMWETHLIDHHLVITLNSISGTFTDSSGHGTINGRISDSGRAVNFIKAYAEHSHDEGEGTVRWEYEGGFTPCGIAGEWHYPGDPPALAIHRGKFALWLSEDEDRKAPAGQDRLSYLTQFGKLLD